MKFLMIFLRGAEAGGILGVNTPHFLEGLKKGSWIEAQQKLGGLEKNLGGKKIFRGGKKILGGKNF